MIPQNRTSSQTFAVSATRDNSNAWALEQRGALTENEQSSPLTFQMVTAKRIKNIDLASSKFEKIIVESSNSIVSGRRTTFLQIFHSDQADPSYIDTSTCTKQQLMPVFSCLKHEALVSTDILRQIEDKCIFRERSQEEIVLERDIRNALPTTADFNSLLEKANRIDEQFFTILANSKLASGPVAGHIESSLDPNKFFYAAGDYTLLLARYCLSINKQDWAKEALRSILTLKAKNTFKVLFDLKGESDYLQTPTIMMGIVFTAMELLGSLLFRINKHDKESDEDFQIRKHGELKEGLNELFELMQSARNANLEKLFFDQLKVFSGLERDFEFPKHLAELGKTLHSQYFQMIMQMAESHHSMRPATETPSVNTKDRDIKTASEMTSDIKVSAEIMKTTVTQKTETKASAEQDAWVVDITHRADAVVRGGDELLVVNNKTPDPFLLKIRVCMDENKQRKIHITTSQRFQRGYQDPSFSSIRTLTSFAGMSGLLWDSQTGERSAIKLVTERFLSSQLEPLFSFLRKRGKVSDEILDIIRAACKFRKKTPAEEAFDALLKEAEGQEWTEIDGIKEKIIGKFDALLEQSKKANHNSGLRLAKECYSRGFWEGARKACESVLDNRGPAIHYRIEGLIMLADIMSNTTKKENRQAVKKMVEDLYKRLSTTSPFTRVSQEVASIWMAHVAILADINGFDIDTPNYLLSDLLKRMALHLADVHYLRLLEQPKPPLLLSPSAITATTVMASAAVVRPMVNVATAPAVQVNAPAQPRANPSVPASGKPKRKCTIM